MPTSDSSSDFSQPVVPAPSVKTREREKAFPVRQITSGTVKMIDDPVVIEEPMEIRIVFGPDGGQTMRSLSVTMRTPGNDEELAAGFLRTEGILDGPAQITGFKILGTDGAGNATGNIVRVNLRQDVEVDFSRLQRNFFTTSSCGVCGKASLESLEVQGLKPLEITNKWSIPRRVLHQLPAALRSQQPTFARTGGLHAAAICSAGGLTPGNVVHVREDVGRHNAVDKLVGRCFLDGQCPLSDYLMVISGRASFEIMQKALVAGIPMIVAVGAPSSLAIEIAQQYNMTLVGFASADRFNIYAGEVRIEN